VGSNPKACAASDACHAAGTCDPATGTCSNPNAADGTPCTDGDVCNGEETCQAGTCVAGTPLVCDDGDACTTDACDAVKGCEHAGACSRPSRRRAAWRTVITFTPRTPTSTSMRAVFVTGAGPDGAV
jgi:hypothetical protein